MGCFNILVSCRWGDYWGARREVEGLLKLLGDGGPKVRRTMAEGVIGVETSLNPFEVVQKLRNLIYEKPDLFQYTLKWVPVEVCTSSEVEDMKDALAKLKDKVLPSERWRMTIEKRRYTKLHKIDLIKELAELIEAKVDLKNFDKEVMIQIIGRKAYISVLGRGDVFSIPKAFMQPPPNPQ